MLVIIFIARCYAQRGLCCRKMSVRLSDRPSITRQYSIETAKHVIRYRVQPHYSTLCSKKTCDHIFDDTLKQNYPFSKIFGTLITKSVGHRQVYLVSHLTYFVHLLYLGKLPRPKYHEFSPKYLIFTMLQYYDINCKIVTILFCLLIIQLTVYNRTITRYIADENVVYQ